MPRENTESDTIDSKAAPAKGGKPTGKAANPDEELTPEQLEAAKIAEIERQK